ncbi:MAG: TRAP transporter substrate-binding protein [Roseomonas sp.]|nr:TRAP transporter substrate-binding protein [Roseomonas sp.]MCA3289528.1 TRAP transporter substrate-binding protein [Roseomonas sp.]MCA3294113.1 TRAP transporter substrate-binding protein [Roseomonas sp.]
MKNLSRRNILAAPFILTPLAIREAQAQARWQVATAYPDGNFHTRNIRSFLDEVKAQTGIDAQLHSNGSLLPMPQIKRGVQQGQVQIGEILLSAYGNDDPFFEVDSIPQLAWTDEQARKLATLSRPYIEARFQRQGLSVLYSVPWPPSGFYTNVPVENLEVLRGSRMRTFNAMTNRFATLLGATPTLVQAAEVPQAFATGVVNSMVTSAATGVDSAAWDFAKIFTPIGFTRTHNVIFVQRRAFEALPAAQQTAMREAAKRAEDRGWALSAEARDAAQATLAARGMQVMQPTPAVMEGLSRISQTIAQEWAMRAGEDGARLLAAYRA